MSDKQFSIGIKITIIIATMLIIGMMVIGITALKTRKNTFSVFEEVPNASNVILQEDVINENDVQN